MKAPIRLVFSLMGLFLAVQIALRIWRKTKPFPMPAELNALVLDGACCRYLVSPGTVIGRVAPRPGQSVLEVGAGQGDVAEAMARAVGPDGQVWVVDSSPENIERLRQRVLAEALPNLEAKFAQSSQTGFAEQTFDIVNCVNTFGAAPDQQGAVWEAYRVLKPGGTLAITECVCHADFVLKGTVVERCEEAGFYLVEEHGYPWLYTLTFRKPGGKSNSH